MRSSNHFHKVMNFFDTNSFNIRKCEISKELCQPVFKFIYEPLKCQSLEEIMKQVPCFSMLLNVLSDCSLSVKVW